MHWTGSVIIPTLICIVKFLVFYVVLGGPAPLGTLSLGAVCFIISWYTLWKSMVAPSLTNVDALGDDVSAAKKASAERKNRRLSGR